MEKTIEQTIEQTYTKDREDYDKSLRSEAIKTDGGILKNLFKKAGGDEVTNPNDLMYTHAQEEDKARNELSLKAEISRNGEYYFGLEKNFYQARKIAQNIIPNLSEAKEMHPNFFIVEEKAKQEGFSPSLLLMHIYHYPASEKYESEVSLMRKDISLCMMASALELAKQDKSYAFTKERNSFGKSSDETLESSIHTISLFHDFFVLDKIMRGNVDKKTKTDLLDSVYKAWTKRNPSASTENQKKKKEEAEFFVNEAIKIFSKKAKKYNIDW